MWTNPDIYTVMNMTMLHHPSLLMVYTVIGKQKSLNMIFTKIVIQDHGAEPKVPPYKAPEPTQAPEAEHCKHLNTRRWQSLSRKAPRRKHLPGHTCLRQVTIFKGVWVRPASSAVSQPAGSQDWDKADTLTLTPPG